MPARSGAWLRAFREGAVIVVSILLALAVQAWWEGRQDAALEAEAIRTLRNELVMVDTLFLWSDDQSLSVTRGASYLLAASADPGRASPDSIRRALDEVGQVGNTDSWLASYELLVNSGNLDVLSNAELAQRVVNLNGLMRVKERGDQREMQLVDTQLRPFIDRYTDLNDVPHRAWYRSRGVEPPEPTARLENVRAILTEPAFRNLLHRRIDMRIWAQSIIARMQVEIDAIRELTEGTATEGET